MTEPPILWIEDYPVRTYEVHTTGSLSPITLFNYAQDAAAKHALAFNLSTLNKDGHTYIWVLSRLTLRMNRYPGNGETLRVKTWPAGITKLYILRYFSFLDESGIQLGSAESAWVIIDMDTRRPKRPERVLDVDEFPVVPGQKIVSFPKLPQIEVAEADSESYFTVRVHDIDGNRHVNNVAYITWLVESMPSGLLHENQLAHVDLQFMGEAFFGDTVRSLRMADDNDGGYLHGLLEAESGRELMRARTLWK